MHEVGENGAVAVLLHRAADGDELAWRELVDRHTAVVWGGHNRAKR